MEFIWLLSDFADIPEPVATWPSVSFVEPRDHRLNIRSSATLIIQIGDEPDAEQALTLLEDTSRPIWIFDPRATVARSIQWIKSGAAQVVTDVTELEKCMTLAAAATTLRHISGNSLIGISQPIRKIGADIEMVANRRCNLLIEGETGTGKEVVARAVHAGGNRSRGPWIAINCSAIPEALLEAELFGYVKGAFTGAVQSRPGKFEAANHGTIFLDEIGDMPLSIQAKLLRVLQEREVQRLGAHEHIRLDVRVIAATNVNLIEKVAQGAFREDLYYRLNVFRIELPPLRERTEDIPLLARHFVEKICRNESFPCKTIDSTAADRLISHSWPGNVRELENVIEAGVIRSGSRAAIYASDLRLRNTSAVAARQDAGPTASLPAEGLDYGRAVEEFEKNLLTQALTRTRGNKTAAADLLGLKRTTLAAKMRVIESRMPRLVA